MLRHPKVASAVLLCVLTVACEGYPAAPLADDPPTSLALGAPANFAGTAGASGIQLGWTDFPDETSYKLQRQRVAPDSVFKVVASPAQNATGYLDAAVASGVTYIYRLRGVDASGNGAWSYDTVTALSVSLPATPGGFSATTPTGPVVLNWSNVANETRYELDRALAPVGGALGVVYNLPNRAEDSTSFTDTAVKSDKRYRFRVRACNSAGCSAFDSVFVTSPAPAKPTGFAADVSGAAVDLDWNDVADETRYELDRALAPLGGGTSGNVDFPNQPANTTGFSDETTTPGTRYRYRIRACDEIGCSAFATIYAVTTSGAPPAQFDVELVFVNAPTPTQQAAFENAVAKWQAVITGDIPDFGSNLPAACGNPAVTGGVDDLKIYVVLELIDGVGGILGSAGPCFIRGNALAPTRFPITGRMRFDAADLAWMISNGTFERVILHEMGHVLGIGTLWDPIFAGQTDLLRATNGSDPYFSGAQARAGFNNVGGESYLLKRVPVENSGGGGTIHAHWRESVFDHELMTGYIDAPGTGNPMSQVTVRSLADHGYVVNVGEAESYTLPSATLRVGDDPGIELEGDVLDGPIYTVDQNGDVERVR